MTYKITGICYQGHGSQYEDINTVNLNQFGECGASCNSLTSEPCNIVVSGNKKKRNFYNVKSFFMKI